MRNSMLNTVRILGSAALIALLPASLQAGGVTDGRAGPVVMTDDMLNHAMTSLNDFLQAKYAQDDALAALDETPANDFAVIASATGETPLDRELEELGSFGWTVSGGRSLDLHLASFNDEVLGREDSLFIRIARSETGKAMTFDQAAADYKSDYLERGRIFDDPSLNAELLALSDSMREFDNRLAKIARAVPEVTGTSFERYTDALALY